MKIRTCNSRKYSIINHMMWLGKVLLITILATTVKGGSKDVEEISLIARSHEQPHLTVSDSVPWFIDYDFEDERLPEYKYETSTENVSHISVVRKLEQLAMSNSTSEKCAKQCNASASLYMERSSSVLMIFRDEELLADKMECVSECYEGSEGDVIDIAMTTSLGARNVPLLNVNYQNVKQHIAIMETHIRVYELQNHGCHENNLCEQTPKNNVPENVAGTSDDIVMQTIGPERTRNNYYLGGIFMAIAVDRIWDAATCALRRPGLYVSIWNSNGEMDMGVREQGRCYNYPHRPIARHGNFKNLDERCAMSLMVVEHHDCRPIGAYEKSGISDWKILKLGAGRLHFLESRVYSYSNLGPHGVYQMVNLLTGNRKSINAYIGMQSSD